MNNIESDYLETWKKFQLRSKKKQAYKLAILFQWLKAWPHTRENRTKFVWILSWVIFLLWPATHSSEETHNK